jgi:hypothetical protein
MDTDDLSIEAYDAILMEAEKLSPDLTLQYGLLSDQCSNEVEYTRAAKELSIELMELDDPDLDDLFMGCPPGRKELEITLRKIIGNIERIERIPLKERHHDE